MYTLRAILIIHIYRDFPSDEGSIPVAFVSTGCWMQQELLLLLSNLLLITLGAKTVDTNTSYWRLLMYYIWEIKQIWQDLLWCNTLFKLKQYCSETFCPQKSLRGLMAHHQPRAEQEECEVLLGASGFRNNKEKIFSLCTISWRVSDINYIQGDA